MLQETKKVQKNPLFRQIETKYKEDEDSEIEKRKRHLQSLRELRAPLDHDEIVEHSKKTEELAKERLEVRK